MRLTLSVSGLTCKSEASLSISRQWTGSRLLPRFFASSEQDDSQQTAKYQHNPCKPQKQRDVASRENWHTQHEQADQHKRTSAYFRGRADRCRFTPHPCARAPIHENNSESDQSRGPSR